MKQFIFFICSFALIIGTMIYGIVINNQNQVNTDLSMQNTALITQIDSTMDRYQQLQEDFDLLKETHAQTLSELEEQQRKFDGDRQRFTEQMQKLQSEILTLKLNESENLARIAELEAEVLQLNNNIATIDAEKTALEQENAELLTRVNDYELHISDLNKQIDEMVAQLNVNNELFQKLVNGTITEIKAQDLQGVTEIRPYAFYKCTKLTSIEIPDTVKKIGDNAFDGSGLTSIYLPNSLAFSPGVDRYQFQNCSYLETVIFEDGITETADFMFKNCINLKNVTLPNTLTRINNETFYGCRSLETILIPETVTIIWHDVFSACTSLSSITLPNNLTTLGTRVFSRCSSLTYIKIPDSVTKISGDSVFYYCTSLETVDLGKNWLNFSSNHITSCTNLKNFIIRCETVPVLSSNSFLPSSNPVDFKCYVLDELVDEYKTAEGWSTYAEYFAPISEYEALQEVA